MKKLDVFFLSLLGALLLLIAYLAISDPENFFVAGIGDGVGLHIVLVVLYGLAYLVGRKYWKWLNTKAGFVFGLLFPAFLIFILTGLWLS